MNQNPNLQSRTPSPFPDLDRREAEGLQLARIVHDNKIWGRGYARGRAEEAELWQRRRWPDLIFAFIIGSIAGVLLAGLVTWFSRN